MSEWADANRRLSGEASAEPGQWRTERAPYQRAIMDAVSDPAVHTVVVMAASQTGKALAVDTPLPTPAGWTRMGDLSVGDRLYDERGQVTEVVFATDVMLDRPTYRVTFSDGETLVADGDHRWYVQSDTALSPGSSWTGKGAREGVFTTHELLQFGVRHSDGVRARFAVPVAGELSGRPVDIGTDPYLIGLWLGDGHAQSATIFSHKDDAPFYLITLQNAGHVVAVAEDGPNTVALQIDRRMRKKGARRGGSFHAIVFNFCPDRLKRIPPILLRASVGQRWRLLQGIMDADGHCTDKGRCEITFKSRDLIDDLVELVRSLGIKPGRVTEKIVSGRAYYRIGFTAYCDQPVFSLPRKRERLPLRDGRRTTESLRRRIESIESVASVPVRCIQVANSSGLFLAGRGMIPTHNTEILNNIVGFHIDQDPAPILVVQPTLAMAEAWSKDRLAPMLRDTPTLKGKVADARARDSGNTLLHKVFAGGHVTVAGANSPSSLASRPIRIVLTDEVDRYPVSAGAEGDPIALAHQRARTFWNRKLVITSTPTIHGASRIEKAFEESDRRRLWVPCPHCGEDQVLVWAHVKWDEGLPETARYECEHCGERWTDAQRWAAVRDGEWRAESEFNGSAGFHLSALVSPWVELGAIAREFWDGRKDPERHKTFKNLQLGETWQESGEAPEWERLFDRAHANENEHVYGLIPDGALLLTAGADIQKDRIEVYVWAWGRDLRSWLVERRVKDGDPSRHEPWAVLDDVLAETWDAPNGAMMQVSRLAVDMQYSTQEVFGWVRRQAPGRVMAVRGVDRMHEPLGAPRIIDLNQQGKRIRRGAKYQPVGVSILKSEFYGWLRQGLTAGETPVRGRVNLPRDVERDVVRQLVAEQLITLRSGRREWKLVGAGERNEALDCRNYARAAAIAEGVDRWNEGRWQRLEASFGAGTVAASDEHEFVPPTPDAPVAKVNADRAVMPKGMQHFRSSSPYA